MVGMWAFFWVLFTVLFVLLAWSMVDRYRAAGWLLLGYVALLVLVFGVIVVLPFVR